MTHFIAAACALLVIPLLRRWKLQSAGGVDLAPSIHWPAPVVTSVIEDDAGPVLVTVEYAVPADNREHLRQHERATQADHAAELEVRGFSISEPKTTHLITPA